jgi:porin
MLRWKVVMRSMLHVRYFSPVCCLLLLVSTASAVSPAQDPTSQAPQDKQSSHSASAPVPEASVTASHDLLNTPYLLGDCGGKRSALEAKGLKFDFYYTDDALANPYGGRADVALWGRIRGSADVDFSKFTRWQGLTFHITGLWQYGTDLTNQYTGTLVNSSSLPSAHTLRLDSYFLQQYALHHKVAFRAGQIAAYDTYGNSEYGASYINLVMGYAHSNLNQAVVFAFNPAGVPSFEVKVNPTKHVYIKGMVQSEERNPYTIDKSGFAFHLGGPVVATEAGYLVDPPNDPGANASTPQAGNHPGVYKFGSGYNPHNFVDPLTNVSSPGNYLVYGQATQAVYRMGKVGPERDRGLDLIYGEDWSPGDVTQNNHQIMAGARWNGVFGGRHSKDTLAVGYVWTSVGSHYREAQVLAGKPNLTHEHLFEVNYLAHVTPWLVLQPVAQWYVQPGGDASRGIVFATGLRTKITF